MKDENVLYNLVEYLKANRIINRDIEIAEKTGYSRQIISNYISGRQKPSKQFMNKFIESYGLQSTETKIITPDKSDITSIRKGKTKKKENNVTQKSKGKSC